MTITTTTRNADLGSILALLQEQNARKVDVVAPATSIRSENGTLIVQGTEQQITLDGVTTTDGRYVPTAVCDEGLAAKLGVPVGYLKTLRADRPDLYDANVNGWLHGADALMGPWHPATDPANPALRESRDMLRPGFDADSRSFLLRAFRGDDGEHGIARAFLSNRYSMVDNLDVLMAALEGIRAAGVEVNIDGGDLTDRRMVVRVRCPEVQALAPQLLAGYRSPFTGQQGADNPTVFAGFQISNSEVGGGAFSIVPRLVVQVCNNGMTITKDAMSKVHVGGRLDAGVVQWGADTQAAAVELVTKQTRDAVRTFLSTDYLTGAITRLEERAEQPVATHDEVKVIAKAAKFTDAEVEGILSYFTQGGQMTRGGVANAVTAYAQTVEDGDQAYALEARAGQLLGV